MFYRCLINHSQIQYWNDGSFKAQCSNTEEKILLKIETDIWTISGLFKL